MSRPSEDVLRVVEAFNKAYFDRALQVLTASLPAVASGRRVGHQHLWTTDGHLNMTPYQLMVGIVRGMHGGYEVHIEQGPLVIASAIMVARNRDHAPVIDLSLQTNPLSVFQVYPLHILADEPDDFFHNRGYGRLMLYFAALHCICAAETLRIECFNVITAYILFQMFRPDSFTAADAECNHSDYLAQLDTARRDHAIADFGEFETWFTNYRASRRGRPVIYLVYATERNRAAFTEAIARWQYNRIESATDEQFMSRFLHAPAPAPA
jgi:hypothetical protein